LLIISRVARRIHVPALHPGEILLDESQAHHLRDVLRLKTDAAVELFDDAGQVARAVVTRADATGVALRVDAVEPTSETGELIVASAVPKGDRADWMVEKLSELGVTRFVPLQTERSVVHPTGSGKRDRWARIATESAKQSKRTGVMQIDELTTLTNLLHRETGLRPVPEQAQHGPEARVTLYLSTRDDAASVGTVAPVGHLTLLIGPEGGWSDDELKRFNDSNLTGVKLTATILRVETAAIAAAAIAATLLLRR
jgi:16S rRNA (uracil1498-N3)-methyltransferase